METFIPPLTVLANPRAKTIIDSVAINGWMPKLAVNRPAVLPQAAPMIRHRGTANQGDQPQWIDIIEKQTATKANTLPTDRSIPPAIITNVMPQARIPYTEACRKVAVWVSTLKNAPSALNNMPNNSTSNSAIKARPAGLVNTRINFPIVTCSVEQVLQL